MRPSGRTPAAAPGARRQIPPYKILIFRSIIVAILAAIQGYARLRPQARRVASEYRDSHGEAI
ncbi:hypothetical protein A33K_13481 [Burkholderia humptydooensis MSMB43]|uniref:Uncharacterized protein n=1 Tax=Burkholderia humptydooensis MSMB43 TaxID=441157 RepID=A0ABN0GC99_9BURK|nr:hypothetical protein A33K_13481 [Burkholderia humptydooensis MSMB43]